MRNEKLAQEFLKDYLYPCLRKEGLVNLIWLTGGKIPGFSKNKYIKAPEPIIRKVARDQIRHMKSSYEFLEKLVQLELNKYEELTLEEFFTKLEMDDDMQDDEKLILFFMKYPELFEEKRDQIAANMKAKRPPLENIIEMKQTDLLQMVSNINDEQLKKKVDSFYKFYMLQENEQQEEESLTLTELFETAHSPGDGQYIRAFYNHYDELLAEDDANQEAFYRLLLTDLTTIALAEHVESRKELYEAIRSLKESAERALQLEDQLDKKEEEMNRLTTNYEALKKVEQAHDDLQEEVARLNEQLRQSSIRLIERDHLYVVTNRSKEQWAAYVDPSQIIVYDTYAQLNDVWKKADVEAVYFVDQYRLSSKQMFDIEKQAESIKMRFVSGSFPSMVRTIIYYLESELRYETIKKD